MENKAAMSQMSDDLIKTEPRSRGTALIADDELSNRVILKSLLKKNGYEVILAVDGKDAVNKFHEHAVDLVFMDVMMPIMDGYEAASKIKEIAANHFVPIIFLTAITGEDALAHCIEVGGDDFLTKPLNHTLLRAKILAMERIRDLHRDLYQLYGRMQRDEEIAEQVFSNAVLAGNVAFKHIRSLSKSADIFSGDILLTSYSPANDLNILLGDFTGHGLAAALGALPVSEVFRSMSMKGFPPAQILGMINEKLSSMLPTGMFLAAQYVTIDHELDHITVCNCGMPDMLLLDGSNNNIKQRITSTSLPLGIDSSLKFQDEMKVYFIKPGDRVLLATDGVSEARNINGEFFGQARIDEIVNGQNNSSFVLDTLTKQLEEFCGDAAQDDDITAAEIPCVEALFSRKEFVKAVAETPHAAEHHHIDNIGDDINLSLTLHHGRLRTANPIPLLIGYIQETVGLDEHRATLFTLLTELYINALDHGVLGLSSKLKDTSDGFTHYLQKRGRLLARLDKGYITIGLKIEPNSTGGKIIITIEDSGKGFDFRKERTATSDTALCGRGLLLINELCESLEYYDPGNKVVAIYAWSN
jgi:serine phosphatase RsbU (regulator of sigma subunit)